MRIKFTKCIYEDYVVDVDDADFEDRLNGDVYDAVFDEMHRANKTREFVEIEDIEVIDSSFDWEV